MHICFSTYDVEVWIFPFLTQVDSFGWSDSCYSGLNFTCLGYLPYFILNDIFSFDLNYFFKVLNQWIMDQVPIGNKAPRPGHARQFWCPACRGLLENPLALTSGHVLLECMAVEGTSCPRFFCFIFCSGTRIREGIRSFIDECWAVGRSSASAHFLYVNGLDSKRSKIPVKDHLKRGASLSRLVKMWLDTWG